MHPAFYWWWKNVRGERGASCETGTAAGGCGSGATRGCGPGFGRHGHGGQGPGASGPGGSDEGFGGGGPFGVRRPLRFLTAKLELRDAQVEELAKILNELKTERAQAEVDHQRTIAAFADAIEGDAFDAARAAEGGALRVSSAEALRAAVVKALGRIHAVLDEAQRKKLAYFVRTGILSI